MQKAIIYGLGHNYCFGLSDLREKYDIIAITDSSIEQRESAKLMPANSGLTVISPEEIMKYQFDLVVITPDQTQEIKQFLFSIGVPQTAILEYKLKTVSPFAISPDFFVELNISGKKKLFAENVESVNIEVNSYCNRRCWFCGNSAIDRHSSNIPMSDDLFKKIIDELTEIDYCGVICYAIYNEPLTCETLEEKIRYVKNKLPNCAQLVNTNGDYLTKEKLESLSSAGLDNIIISVYEKNDPHNPWTLPNAKETTHKIMSKLDLSPICQEVTVDRYVAYTKYKDINIRLQDVDFTYQGYNRGEILKDDEVPLPVYESRDVFCCNSFFSFNIYYSGDVFPCGNTRPDWDKHTDFNIGNCNEQSIFDLFAGEKATMLRKRFIKDINSFPHSSCSFRGDTCIPQYPNIPLRQRPYDIRLGGKNGK
jgi:MoaA/NifB/PqqE/SkfB family radical SAM enzyme